MTNSSWTQNHILSLLSQGRNSLLASLLLLDEKSLEKNKGRKGDCEVVYPACDTAGLVALGHLDKRRRVIVSLAQFRLVRLILDIELELIGLRPEKEHSKQIYALAEVFTIRPDWRGGEGRIDLVMMGGARHPADEARVEGLRGLAKDLGVQVCFLYSTQLENRGEMCTETCFLRITFNLSLMLHTLRSYGDWVKRV
jgi:alpha-1,2-mannosyltransferase